MTTKKQAKAQELRRRQQLERKIVQRRERRARMWRVGFICVAAAAVLALVVWGIVSAASSDGDTPAVTDPAASPAATGTDAPARDGDDIELATGWGVSPAPPNPESAEGRVWTVEMDTNQGAITLELDGAAAPQAVASFVALAQDDFFTQTDCHRLVTQGIFVLQCGDPTSTGTGGPAYRFGPIENAPEGDFYPAGTLAMARTGGNGESMGSQFFMVYGDSTIPSDVAGGYTVFGTVTEGLAIVESIAQSGTIEGTTDGRPTLPLIINEVSVS